MKTYEVHTNGGGLQYVKGDSFSIEHDGVLVWREDDDEPGYEDKAVAYFPVTGFISIQLVKEEED